MKKYYSVKLFLISLIGIGSGIALMLGNNSITTAFGVVSFCYGLILFAVSLRSHLCIDENGISVNWRFLSSKSKSMPWIEMRYAHWVNGTLVIRDIQGVEHRFATDLLLFSRSLKSKIGKFVYVQIMETQQVDTGKADPISGQP